MKKELMDKILSEISKGIKEARKSIKKYGAAIPKQDIMAVSYTHLTLPTTERV